MALIKCTECGKEISDSAVACPHCGCKTAHGQKAEATQTFNRMNWIVNLIFIALDIIGIILLFNGLAVEAEERCVTGFVLVTIGFVGAILYKKYIDRLMVSTMISATNSAGNAKLEKAFKNAAFAPPSSKKTCPYCGNVVTSNICDMCGREIL